MSKTFKSVALPNVSVSIKPSSDGVRICAAHGLDVSNVTVAPSDAPALALAILEAAGYKEEQGNETTEAAHHFGMSMLHLRYGIKEQEYITAEAEAQAKLEAEAVELYNACMGHNLTSWAGMGEKIRDQWLAVARRAREINKEDTK